MQTLRFTLVLALFSAAIFFAFTTRQKTTTAPKIPPYTKAQIDKGRYLVQIMGCADCHAPKKMTAQGPIPDPAQRWTYGISLYGQNNGC